MFRYVEINPTQEKCVWRSFTAAPTGTMTVGDDRIRQVGTGERGEPAEESDSVAISSE